MFNKVTDCYTLSNGVQIPCVGFGTWQTPSGDVAVESVCCALQAGYVHIDTAEAYGNEKSVGEGIKKSGVKREDIFVTSKLANNIRGYEETIAAFNKTIEDLGLEYLDMFLIHWPNPKMWRDCWQEKNAETWRAFEDLYKAGKIRAIGVSNFRPHHLEELKKTATIMPHVNQIKLCPGCTEDEVVTYCRENNMLLEAYSPMGVGAIFEVKEMQELAAKYNRTIAQICIRWSLQRGYLPLPKSVTPSRIIDNLNIFDFELSEEEVEYMSKLTGCVGLESDPDNVPF